MDTTSNHLILARSKGLRLPLQVRGLITLGLAIAPALNFAEAAWSANYTVSKTADANDGVCDSDCSLREAISVANASVGIPDNISLPTGTYTLSISGMNEDSNATGDLDITDNLTINGSNAVTTVIDGAGHDRVLQVVAGIATLSGVTIRNGHETDGGGILNGGTLAITNSVISSNTANNSGGGVFNFGTMFIIRSTVNDNTAKFSSGGGIINVFGGGMTITNSTVGGNRSPTGGGGIFLYLGGKVTINNSTVNANSAPVGNGIWQHSGSAVLKNTIVANAVPGSNCAGSIASLGYNLSSDATCSLTGAGDLNSTNPLLSPLGIQAGFVPPYFTPIYGLANSSPARNHVALGSCKDANGIAIATDQRGVSRPQQTKCDVGAIEWRAGPSPH